MVWLILLLAFFLRLVNLNQSLWWDEAINVVYAQNYDFWWFISKYPIGDFHPPGWFAILWNWGHIAGFSEIAVRLPSVFLGVMTVGLTYLLGKELFNKKAGLLAALLLAIAPLHVYYSQEARMYAFAAFAVTLSFCFLHQLMTNKKWAVVGYTASLILVLYSDYLSILVIPTQILYLIWVKKLNKRVLLSYLIAGTAFLPWLSIFPLQFQTGMNKAIGLPDWGQVVGGNNVKDLLLIPIKTFFGKAALSNKVSYVAISIFVGVIFGSIILYGMKKMDQSTKLLLSWIIIPITLAFLISFFIPVLSYFRMLYILPAFYLLAGKSLTGLSKRIAMAALVFVCFVSISSLLGYYLLPGFQRENWKGAVSLISKKLDQQTLVLFENSEIPAPVKYYSSNLTNYKPGLSENLTGDLSGKKKVYLFEYLADVYDPKKVLVSKLRNLGYAESATYDFDGVGFIREYTKY